MVRRTQVALARAGEPPVHFAARFAVTNYMYAVVAGVVFSVLQSLARFSWGRQLLLR